MYLKPKGDIMRETVPAINRMAKEVKYPKGGGVLTYFWNEKFPEKQLVYPEMFAILNPIKRTIPVFLRLLKESHLAKFLFALSFILPGAKKLRGLVLKHFAGTAWCGLRFVAFLPEHYCPSGKELRRALIAVFPGKGHVEELIDIACLFWEYDNAYRCFGQDVAGIINKEAFLAHPAKEAKRVADEFLRRIVDKNIVLKAKPFTKLAPLVMYIPKYRKLARRIVAEIDFEKVKMDLGDRYWTYPRTDYNVDGMCLVDRMMKRQLMKLN